MKQKRCSLPTAGRLSAGIVTNGRRRPGRWRQTFHPLGSKALGNRATHLEQALPASASNLSAKTTCQPPALALRDALGLDQLPPLSDE
jgi:hypothetical protein